MENDRLTNVNMFDLIAAIETDLKIDFEVSGNNLICPHQLLKTVENVHSGGNYKKTIIYKNRVKCWKPTCLAASESLGTIDFVKLVYGVDYGEARDKLCELMGIKGYKSKPLTKEEISQKIQGHYIEYCKNVLRDALKNPTNDLDKKLVKCLGDRGITENTIAKYRMGFSDNKFIENYHIKHSNTKFGIKDFVDAGIVSVVKNEEISRVSYVENFAKYLLVPVYDGFKLSALKGIDIEQRDNTLKPLKNGCGIINSDNIKNADTVFFFGDIWQCINYSSNTDMFNCVAIESFKVYEESQISTLEKKIKDKLNTEIVFVLTESNYDLKVIKKYAKILIEKGFLVGVMFCDKRILLNKDNFQNLWRESFANRDFIENIIFKEELNMFGEEDKLLAEMYNLNSCSAYFDNVDYVENQVKCISISKNCTMPKEYYEQLNVKLVKEAKRLGNGTVVCFIEPFLNQVFEGGNLLEVNSDIEFFNLDKKDKIVMIATTNSLMKFKMIINRLIGIGFKEIYVSLYSNDTNIDLEKISNEASRFTGNIMDYFVEVDSCS